MSKIPEGLDGYDACAFVAGEKKEIRSEAWKASAARLNVIVEAELERRRQIEEPPTAIPRDMALTLGHNLRHRIANYPFRQTGCLMLTSMEMAALDLILEEWVDQEYNADTDAGAEETT